jgi:hypothetical protein
MKDKAIDLRETVAELTVGQGEQGGICHLIYDGQEMPL